MQNVKKVSVKHLYLNNSIYKLNDGGEIMKNFTKFIPTIFLLVILLGFFYFLYDLMNSFILVKIFFWICFLSFMPCLGIETSKFLLKKLNLYLTTPKLSPEDRKKWKNININQLSGIEFECVLRDYFKALGYHVTMTPKSNDYGADLILLKNNVKTVVQTKRYSEKVGIHAIQEIIGAKNYYGANRMLVITNSSFTQQAINLASASDVELWDGNHLRLRFH